MTSTILTNIANISKTMFGSVYELSALKILFDFYVNGSCFIVFQSSFISGQMKSSKSNTDELIKRRFGKASTHGIQQKKYTSVHAIDAFIQTSGFRVERTPVTF